MQRHWKADPFLDEVMQVLVMRKTSMASMIQHSHVLKDWYQTYQDELGDDKNITTQKDMSLAKHRFETASKTLIICCATLRSVNKTAQRAWVERKNEVVGANALAHLDFLEGEMGAERMCQAGMLSDAADEGLLFTRFGDVENADTSLLLSQATHFMCRIKVLFVDGKALKMGVTKLMVATIRDVMLYWGPGDVPKKIGLEGGVTGEIIARCLQRMCGWVTLAILVVETEFPDFDIMASFMVFALSTEANEDCSPHLRFNENNILT